MQKSEVPFFARLLEVQLEDREALTVRTDEALKRAAKLKSKRKVSLAPRSPEDDFDLDLDLEDEEMMEGI